MNTTDNTSIEIDILYLLKKLWQKKVLIIFSALLFGLVALVFSAFVVNQPTPLQHEFMLPIKQPALIT